MAITTDIDPAAPGRFSELTRKLRSKSARARLAKRIARYVTVFGLWLAVIWGPIVTYLGSAPATYTSNLSLILPGAGVSASVNMEGIGQASSYASSAFASNAISPTQTYKRLIRADRIMRSAATSLDVPFKDLPLPKVTLVDQTGLIHIEMVGPSPIEAQARAEAVLAAFFKEVDLLRSDDQFVREEGAILAIEEYRNSVQATRSEISNLRGQTGFLSRDQFDAQVTENDSRYATLISLRAQLDEKTAYVAALEKSVGFSADYAARALDLYSDQQYLALVDDAAEKATELRQARSNYGPRHPELRRATATFEDAERATLRKAVTLTGLPASEAARLNVSQFGDRTALLAKLVECEAERAGVQAQYEALNVRYLTEKDRLEQAAVAAAQLEDLQRDFQVAEAVFASAIARAQSSKVDVFASYPLVQVLENPSLPDRPSSPRKKLAVLAGAGATFLVLIALTLGWVRRSLIGWLIGVKQRDA
jgi:uncharacterized protein involved in exopolysaccharide biosynthesis